MTGRPLPAIPWSHPTQAEQFAFYRNLLTHPLTISLALLAVVTIAASLLVLRLRYDGQRSGESWAETLLGDAPSGTIAAGVREAWLDHTGLSATLIAALFIFAVLFTTLFTNLYGLASGTISTDGTLLYWLGQHDYRRGEQPWFYYLLLLPQYEFIAVLAGTIATILIGVRMLLVGLGRAQTGATLRLSIVPGHLVRRHPARALVGGRKMPWLVTHISLPAVLLAASSWVRSGTAGDR